MQQARTSINLYRPSSADSKKGVQAKTAREFFILRRARPLLLSSCAQIKQSCRELFRNNVGRGPFTAPALCLSTLRNYQRARFYSQPAGSHKKLTYISPNSSVSEWPPKGSARAYHYNIAAGPVLFFWFPNRRGQNFFLCPAPAVHALGDPHYKAESV
ncbi:hypothetical protein ElyMa_002561000 [Elysia marginata]|uniref:Uncharacterized protein n=1 Tax=Elysia marginata TaxID=1093978 RepID=A0AAV4GWW4_9GAST|nr:hypothetical protein ElyMa_002561000 [Elysia marginata]